MWPRDGSLKKKQAGLGAFVKRLRLGIRLASPTAA